MNGKHDLRNRNEFQKLFDLRAQYKIQKNPTQEIIKLIMNSSYGKTIQKPIKSYLQFVNKDEYAWFVKDRYHQIKVIYELENGHHLCGFIKNTISQFNNVVFGAIVLLISKRNKSEVMFLTEDLGINIYYQNTDSMHIEHDMVPLLDQKFKKYMAVSLLMRI